MNYGLWDDLFHLSSVSRKSVFLGLLGFLSDVSGKFHIVVFDLYLYHWWLNPLLSFLKALKTLTILIDLQIREILIFGFVIS